MDFIQQAILSTSIVSLLTAALVVGFIERNVKPRERAIAKERNVTFWKFNVNSQKDKVDMMNIDKWSLRKLWFAGSMISSTLVSVTVKRVGMYSLLIGGIFMLIWTLFLAYFWYFEVMKKYERSSEDAGYDSTAWKVLNTSKSAFDKEVTTSEYDANQVPINSNTLEHHLNSTIVDGANNIGSDNPIPSSLSSSITSSRIGNRLPLTIITGFLGSGKTTMIKNILNNTVGIRILVIENEIGEEGIDHDLLLQQTNNEDIILLNNGCICCTVRKDIISTFDKILSDDVLVNRLDWVIIETTGLADPAPLIQTLYMDANCQAHLRLDSVLTIIDAKHFTHHLDTNNDNNTKKGGLFHTSNTITEAVQQVIYADRIILNKIDLISEDDVMELKHTISTININADILTCRYGEVDIDQLLNIRAFDPLKNVALLTESEPKKLFHIPVDDAGKIPLKQMKFGVNGVRSYSTPNSFQSISLTVDDALDLGKLNIWIASLLESKGKDIYRLKGILNIYGYDEMFVAHGIHMIFDGQRGATWAEHQHRLSKLVIIGMNLDDNELKNRFLQCRYMHVKT